MKYVYAGDYYTTKTYGLIKIGAKGINPKTNETMVIFAPVKTGGFVSDALVMEEQELIEDIIK